MPSQREMYTLPLGRSREGRQLFLCLLFLIYLQLKSTFMPKWHIWGWHILIPFSYYVPSVSLSLKHLSNFHFLFTNTDIWKNSVQYSQKKKTHHSGLVWLFFFMVLFNLFYMLCISCKLQVELDETWKDASQIFLARTLHIRCYVLLITSGDAWYEVFPL